MVVGALRYTFYLILGMGWYMWYLVCLVYPGRRLVLDEYIIQHDQAWRTRASREHELRRMEMLVRGGARGPLHFILRDDFVAPGDRRQGTYHGIGVSSE